MTPQELAKVFDTAGDIHEQSWDKEERRYTTSWSDAVEQSLLKHDICKDFYLPIYIAIQTEYVDIWDWVENTLKVSA